MQRQTLVDERIVRRHQIQHAPVLAQNTFNEHFHLTLEGFAQAFVKVGKLKRIGINAIDTAHLQPLESKIGDQ